MPQPGAVLPRSRTPGARKVAVLRSSATAPALLDSALMTTPAPAIVTLTMNPAIDVSTSVGYVIPDEKLRVGLARQ